MLKSVWPPALAGLFAIVLSALTATSAAAQNILTLEQAVQEALARNADVRAAEAGAAIDAARLLEARAGWFPRLSVAESWQRGNQPVFVFGSLLASRQLTANHFAIDALTHPDAMSVHRTSLGVRQSLFDGRQNATVESARIARDAATLTLDEQRAALAVAATGAYARLVSANATRRAMDTAVQSARADRARAADRRDAGTATDADVLALDAHVATLVQRAVEAEGETLIARAELNRLMGSPIDRTYQVIESTAVTSIADSGDMAALLAEAEAARPELRRAALGEQQARAERQLARAALLPRVTTDAGVEVTGTQFTTRATSWVAGADVSWTLSLGGAERARLTAASLAQTKAAAATDAARAAVHVEVITALTEQRAALARIDAGSAAVGAARESERIIRDRVDAGLASVTDLLRAQSAWLDADAQRTKAMADALISTATLHRALGRQP
ncbi:MAG: TolC family protein [Acidobacteriaceae bacterium]|jgi:outer membrane protein TolC|nr:TolC family protein [Acidobacteriaceae bacterium]